MARKRQPDWAAIRAEYLAGIKPRELAAKYGVNDATLRSRASREKWGVEREDVEARVQQNVPDRVVAAILDDIERITHAHLDDLEAARAQARAILPQAMDPQSLKDWAAAYKSILGCQRLALGLDGKPKDAPPDESARPAVVAVPADSPDWQALVDHDG